MGTSIRRFTSFLLAAVILGTSQIFAAAPSYTFAPSGHDGAGGQSAIAADPNNSGKYIAGGDVWAFHRTSNYGRDWAPISMADANDTKGAFSVEGKRKIACVRYSERTANRVYAGSGEAGGFGGFYRSDNGGDTWLMTSTMPQFGGANDNPPLDDKGHPRSVGNLIAVDPNTGGANEFIYAGTYKQGVMRSDDAGVTWETITMTGLGSSASYVRGIAMDPANKQTIYVALWDCDNDGTNESVYKITNARTATTATKLGNPPFLHAEELVVVNGSVYVAAGPSGVYKYDGSSWTQAYGDGGASNWYSIDGYWNGSNAVVFAGSADSPKTTGGLYWNVIRSTNAEAASPTWTPLTTTAGNIINHMGDASGLPWWHFNSSANRIGGSKFVACQLLLDPLDGTHQTLFAAGRGGCWRTDNALAAAPTWYPVVRHQNASVNWDIAVDPNTASRVYNTDMDWTFEYSTDNFNTCVQQDIGPGGAEEFCIAVDSTTNPSAVGAVYVARNGALAYNPDPATRASWADTNMPVGAAQDILGCSVKKTGAGTVVLAAVYGSGIWRKVGAGANGSWGGAPVYTANNIMKGLSASTARTPFSWAGGTSGMVYFTDRENGTFRSMDSGANWAKITGPGVGSGGDTKYSGSVAVDPTNAAHCLVTQTSGIWYSSNANAANAVDVNFTRVTLSNAGTPGMATYDDAGNAYINTIIDSTHDPKLFYCAAGADPTVSGNWTNIAPGDRAFISLAAFAMNMVVGPAPAHKIYLTAHGVVVGTKGGGTDTTPPANVSNVQAVPGDSQVSLSWNNPGDADFSGVRVVRSTIATPTSINDGWSVYEGMGTSCVDSGRVNGVTNYYKIFARDEVPNWSSGTAISAAAIATDSTPPAAPTSFVATPDDTLVHLSWVNPTASDLQGVIVLRKTAGYSTGPDDGYVVYDGLATSNDNGSLKNGVTYYYSIYAYDEVPNYSVAAQAMATPLGIYDTTPPGPVTNFAADTGEKLLSLTWTKPNDADLQGIRIQRSTTGYPANKDAGTTVYDSTGVSYIDEELTSGATYYYSAFTYDDQLNYSSRTTLMGIPLPDTTPPAAPTNTVAVADDTVIHLSWVNPTDSDFAGVRVQRLTSGYPADWTIGRNVYDGTDTSRDNGGLINGLTYYYCVFAYDFDGNFSAPGQAFAIPGDVTPPALVTNLTATASTGQISLSWTNPTDADFAGVRIKYSTTLYVTDPGTSGLYEGTGTSFVHSSLNAGTTYYYSIFSKDEVPNWSAPAQVFAVTPPSTVQVTFNSIAADDGWLRESAQGSGVGGGMFVSGTGTTALSIGDTAAKLQYRTLVSFNTASIPDGATIISADLKLKRGTVTNGNPFTNMGTCYADIKTGSFNGNQALEINDFQAAATHTHVASMSNPAANGDWSVGTLNATGRGDINKTGITQFKVFMTTATDADTKEDVLGCYSGEAASADQPQLVITYQPKEVLHLFGESACLRLAPRFFAILLNGK